LLNRRSNYIMVISCVPFERNEYGTYTSFGLKSIVKKLIPKLRASVLLSGGVPPVSDQKLL
jgi:hypothetical protein